MDQYSHVANDGMGGNVKTEPSAPWSSPFVGGERGLAEAPENERGPNESMAWLSSPFSEGLVDANEPELEAAFTAIAAELEDEGFDEAVQALVDEAAGRHLASSGVWSSEATAHLATGEVEAWMAGIAAEADALLEHLEVRFDGRTPESLLEGELEAALTDALATQGRVGLDGEDFISALARKARSAVKGAANLAKRGIAAAGRRLLATVFKALRRVVRPLLRQVLLVAKGRLPVHLQQVANDLAVKLGIAPPSTAASTPAPTPPGAPGAMPASLPASGPTASEPAAPDPTSEPAEPGATLAELFDAHLARVVTTENEAMADQVLAEWESAAASDEAAEGAVASLDLARAELVDRLADAAPGSVLTTEVEQFVPAVMAALPLIRSGIGLLGRDKVVAGIAAPVAQLIRGLVGPEATTALSRAIADQGLRLLRLEAEAGMEPSGRLGAEALASMLEDTIRAVGYLPAESQAEPVRLRAEVSEAFAEAAARHLPREVLRADLGTHEVEGESVVWVLMPRGPSRRYRYRKCSRIFPAQVSRHVARAIVLRDGGTLEQRFLDEGATAWPVEAEVHLYETLPGMHLGHLAGSEGEASGAGTLDASEFEQLTPQAASLLLKQPGLAGLPPTGSGQGRRYFRVALARRSPSGRRRHKRAVLRLVLTGTRPSMRVHLRLSEREAERVGELIAKRALDLLVTDFRALILGLAQRSLPVRIARQAQRTPGVSLSADQARALALAAGEKMVTALAAQLVALGPTLQTATRDPAPGVTLTFEFGFADRAAIVAGRPDSPTVTVRPGRHRD